LTAPTEVVGDDGVVTALTAGVCFEFDSGSTRLDVGCSGSGAGATGGSGVDSALVDAMLVCAPPLLLTVTPVPTWVLDDVAPEVDVPPAVAVSAAVDVGPVLVEGEPPLVVVAVEVPVPVASAADSVPAGEASVDVDVEPDVSAVATPGEVPTINPIPKAAASAPTRPM
jgi:hypothetical protein